MIAVPSLSNVEVDHLKQTIQFVPCHVQPTLFYFQSGYLDTYGISQFELAKRAGLTPATIYQILKKSENQVTRPPRKSSVQGIARAVGAMVMFNSKSNKILLHHASIPETKSDDIVQFMLQIADAIRQSGRKEIPRDERDKILRVLRVLL